MKLALFFVLAVAAGATQIWTYHGNPLVVQPGSDPSLRPDGLGDHFEITFETNFQIPLDTLFFLGNNPFNPQITWTDGNVSIAAGDDSIQPSTFELGSNHQLTVQFVGVGSGAFFFVGGGSDGVIACNGGFEVCSPYYIEMGTPSTWNFTATPEPATLTMAGLGLALVIGRKFYRPWRRR